MTARNHNRNYTTLTALGGGGKVQVVPDQIEEDLEVLLHRVGGGSAQRVFISLMAAPTEIVTKTATGHQRGPV